MIELSPGVKQPDYPVVIVELDDWRAVYHEGTCVYQGHDIDIYRLKYLLPGETILDDIETWWEEEFNDIGAASGRLPDDLDQLSRQLGDLRELDLEILTAEANFIETKDELVERRQNLLNS